MEQLAPPAQQEDDELPGLEVVRVFYVQRLPLQALHDWLYVRIAMTGELVTLLDIYNSGSLKDRLYKIRGDTCLRDVLNKRVVRLVSSRSGDQPGQNNDGLTLEVDCDGALKIAGIVQSVIHSGTNLPAEYGHTMSNCAGNETFFSIIIQSSDQRMQRPPVVTENPGIEIPPDDGIVNDAATPPTPPPQVTDSD